MNCRSARGGRYPHAIVNEDFRDLLAALVAAGARFLVVGAHALAVHGIPRATGDLDVWIGAEVANAERVFDALVRFGAPMAAMGVTREDPPGPIRSCRSVSHRGVSTS